MHHISYSGRLLHYPYHPRSSHPSLLGSRSRHSSRSSLAVLVSLSDWPSCVGSPKGVHAHGNRSNQIKSNQGRRNFIWKWGKPTETSKEPIRTRSLGHMTSYQPIRD
eukprot:sb/3477658/